MTSEVDELAGREYEDLVDWLIEKVARYRSMPRDAIDPDTPLADYGIDSVNGLALCADLNAERGFTVDTTIVWDYPTIEGIATFLIEERPS
jgi:acyl carrier protein